MKQENYLKKAINKVEKDIAKMGYTGRFAVQGSINDRTPVLTVEDTETHTAASYLLSNAYIRYLEEDISVAKSIKDTRREIAEDIRSACRVIVQDEETFPDPEEAISAPDTPQEETGAGTPSPEPPRHVILQGESSAQDTRFPYDTVPSEARGMEDTGDRNTLPLGGQDIDYGRMQEFEEFDTDFVESFAAKMVELFRWKDQDTAFSIRATPEGVYILETGVNHINLTEANDTYQQNNQSFLEVGLELYREYEDALRTHILEPDAGQEERAGEAREPEDEEGYPDDYFPF